MKKLISAVLAISLLGATAASAQSYRGGGSYSENHARNGNGGALIGLGIGLFALAAIAASQHRDYDRDGYDRRYDDRDAYGRSYGYASPYRNYYGPSYRTYGDRAYGDRTYGSVYGGYGYNR